MVEDPYALFRFLWSVERPAWYDRAACRGLGPARFYNSERHIDMAKVVCVGCPVRMDCLRWAVANPTVTRLGVWGGVGERARRRMRLHPVE